MTLATEGQGMLTAAFTEADWLAWSSPYRMVQGLPPSTRERKYLLFVCAYVRRTLAVPFVDCIVVIT